MSLSAPDISVVMPTLNEEKTIGSCIEKIHQAFEELGMVGEIIIADSSTDRTSEIARSLGAIVVHPDYLGYGNAYLAGLASARGRYIAIGDADDTYDFRDLPKLVRRIDEGYDFVLGSRLKGGDQARCNATPASVHRKSVPDMAFEQALQYRHLRCS